MSELLVFLLFGKAPVLIALATLGGVDVRVFVAPLKQKKYLIIYIHTEQYIQEYEFSNFIYIYIYTHI